MRRTRLALLLVLGMVAALLPMGVAPAVATSGDLVITGVVDGPLTGGVPKVVELYVASNIADLSIYGVGAANNGGGSDGEEFTFPAVSATAGDFIYVATEAVYFEAFFGFAPDYTHGSAPSINGDDAIELFMNGSVVDVFGDINASGAGEPWEYTDGWAYRVSDSGQDGSTFVLANWTLSGPNALGGETTNAAATTPFPIGTYTGTAADSAPSVASSAPADGATGVAVDSNVDISFSEDVVVAGAWYGLSCTASGAVSATVSGGPATYTLDPAADLANDESCTVTVFAAQVTDVDTDDPPDNMGSDHSFTFEVAGVPVDSPAIINEMLADPANDLPGDANGDGTRDAAQDEFVEIANDSASPLDLSGWTLNDAVGVRHTFPAGSMVPAMCSIVVFGGGTPTGVFGNAVVQTASSGSLGLNNTGDTVTLNDGTADVASEGYGSEGGDNQSLTRDPDISGAFVKHSTATDSGGTLFSPGTMVDGTLFAGCESSGPADVVINEVDADTPGDDALEFVELYDGGTGSVALDGLSVVLYNGSDDASYLSFDLDGYSTNVDGYFVIGTVPGADIDVSPGTYGWLQNGADAVAVFAADASEFPNDTPITTNGLIDAVVYDTNDGDDAALLALLNAGQPQVNEGEAGNSAGHSNQRCPNGSGGTLNTDTFAQFAPTPAAENVCVAPAAEVEIHEVQGNGAASPLVGSTVIVEGIVVGDFQDDIGANGDLNGFHLQEEDSDADADPLTSEGIFIYDGYPTAVDVQVGDLVRVEGSVSEYYDLTQITSFSGVSVISSGNPLPTASSLSLPVTSVDDFEATEGMLVTFTQALVISEYYNFGRYGEIVLTSERNLTPTAEFEPGSADAALAAEDYILDSITLDDGRGGQNPDPAIHPNGEVFDLTNLFRGGDTLTNVTGVVDYAFGDYKIQPTQGADYENTNPRTSAPDAVGGDLTVASFNVLNYFTTFDSIPGSYNGPYICGPNEDLECRGANDAVEFDRQRSKIIAALSTMDADVVGLLEIENNINDDAVIDLVDGLNDANGAGTYAYIDTGAIGDDAIKVAYIYKPATVSPVGDYAILDGSVDPRFVDSKNRPVLAQTFMDDTSGGVFTVAVNHLKSKGSDCDDLGDPDLGDGAGNCNLTRTAAAAALVDWLETDPTSSDDDDFLIIGDLNSYDKEDPIDTILAGGYSDLIYDYLGEDAYSYVFDGQVGYLDYALANDALVDEVTGVTVWHINADEANLIDYDTSYKQDAQDDIYAPDAFRSSDHDPVIVGLDLVANPNYLKTESIGALEALLPTGSRYYDKLINRAIGNIEDSLNPAYWEDDFHLTKKGNKVFDEERRAVWDLMRVRGAAEAGADAVIDALIEADMVLAGTAIDDAIAADGSAWWIARAEKEMKRAMYDLDRGRPDKAIVHYKRAWQYSQKAISGCHFGRSFGHMFG